MGKDDSPISHYFRICWFLFQGNQKSVANVEGQPLQVAELPKAGFTEK